MLILTMDANFHLRSKLCDTLNKIHLSLGWSYFVNNGPYSNFIKDYVDQEEVSMFAMIDKAQLICTREDWDLRQLSSPP
jgi:hypothetical protein